MLIDVGYCVEMFQCFFSPHNGKSLIFQMAVDMSNRAYQQDARGDKKVYSPLISLCIYTLISSCYPYVEKNRGKSTG